MKALGTLFVAILLVASNSAALAQAPPPGTGRGPGGPQPGGQIRGVVLDAASGKPVPAVTVGAWSAADSALVTGVVSRPDGSFHIEGLQPGQYYVRVNSLGYETHTAKDIALTPAAPRADLGAIRIAVSAVQMEGVTVTGERSQVTLAPDRNTFLVRDMPAAAGGTATDVLRNVPSIEVDIDGKVSLRGNQNVAVQINGRTAPMGGEQLAQYLQQLPAAMVERVEVVPNPSAKYDPDGMAGILNIVLKQNADLGTSGGFTLGGGTSNRVNASGNVGHQQGPLTLTANYGFFTDERQTNGFNYRENRFLNPLTFLEQESNGFLAPTSHNFNATGEYKLGKRDVLASSLLLSKREFENGMTNRYREMDSDHTLTGRSDRLTAAENDDLTLDYSLSLKRTVEPRKHETSAELRFNRSENEILNRFTQQFLTPGGTPADDRPALERNDLDALAQNWTLQADATRPLGAATRLETGYKGSLRQLDNEFAAALFSYADDDYLADPRRSNTFAFDEQVHAGYGVLNHTAGKFDLQAGVRLEQAATEFQLATTGDSYDNDYFSIFPSGLIAYNLTESQQLKASYSKRIQRPDTRLLNPFAFYEDPLNLFVGNPSLQPEYTHAYELGYQQNGKLGTLQVTPFFRRTTDAVRRFKTVDDNGVSTTTFQNFATSDSWGTDVTGSWRLGRLNGFAALNAFRTVTDGSNVDSELSSDAFSWSTRLNANWRITPRLDAQGFYMYRAPMEVEQGRISGMSMMHLSLRQKLAGDKASVSLRVVDPLNQMRFSFRTSDDRHYQESSRRFGARGVYLSFSYNFGQQPRVRQRPGQEQPEQAPDDIGIR